MAVTQRIVAIVGRLGVHPMVRLPLPARRLIAYLALNGAPITRAVTSAALWPDCPEEVGRANLRRAIWNVPAGWIISTGDELILDAVTDLAEAEEAAARAIDGKELRLADIKLLSSDILPGWHEEWTLAAQEQFRLLRVQALEAACRTMIASNHLALATQAGSAALSAEPLRESAAEVLIEAHLAQNNRYEAVRCYRLFAERLEVELGVVPQPSLAARLGQCRVAS
jgi:DNA-binding SARP family transcriptional activator